LCTPTIWQSLFTNIRSLYPHLSKCSFNFRRSVPVVMPSVDWKASFGGLQSVTLDVAIAMTAATSFLNAITEDKQLFARLEVFKMTKVRCEGEIVEHDAAKRGLLQTMRHYHWRWKECRLNEVELKDFMMAIDRFLKQRPTHLMSFKMELFIPRTESIGVFMVMDGGLEPYSMYLRTVLEMLEGDMVFDGYLEFGFRDHVEFMDQRDEEMFHIMNDEGEYNPNEAVDRDIARLICEIQNKVTSNNRGDKLQMIVRGCAISRQRIEFLRFWFRDERYFYGSNLVMYRLQFVAK